MLPSGKSCISCQVDFGPLTPELSALLAQQHLQHPLADLVVADVEAVVTQAHLEPGDVLVRQDEPATDLYLILRGRVGVHVARRDREPMLVEEIGPGGVTGEMALLSGERLGTTVVAIEPTDAARLARADFEHLAAKHPRALRQFLERILPRLQRNELLQVLTEVFGAFDMHELAGIEPHLKWLYLPGGQELFRAGDAGEDIFIVINGRLRVVAHEADGSERVLEEVGRCGMVGEVALLTGEPRAATIHAVRDTDLLRLSRETFDQLVEHHPRAMMQIAREAATRLARSARGAAGAVVAPTAFAVIGADPDVPLGAFAQRLAAALATSAPALRLGSGDVDRMLANPGIAQSSQGSIVHESMVAWMSGLERDHRCLVLEADPGMTPWTRRCLRQADRVLLVARADGNPAPGAIEQEIARVAPKARVELVLLQPEGIARPAGTAAWLAGRAIAAHHHVRLSNDADLRRLARRLTATRSAWSSAAAARAASCTSARCGRWPRPASRSTRSAARASAR